MTIPRIAHFVFGLKEQDRPFHLVHYLALESCRRVLRPEAIYLHYKHLPYGVYWDLIRPHLTLREVDLAPEVAGGPAASPLIPAQYSYAHHADFVRLDALIEHGGIYADMDTLFVRPFPPDLYCGPFVIGREYPVADERSGAWRPSLCNAVLMAEPGAEFAVAWRQRMGAALNGTWSNHSGFLAEELSQLMPGGACRAAAVLLPLRADPGRPGAPARGPGRGHGRSPEHPPVESSVVGRLPPRLQRRT